MKQEWKKLGRALAPPLLVDAWERRFRRVRFEGDFESWSHARAASTGYDSIAIRERVLAAARVVRDGGAAFERDGVLFAEPDYVWPVAAALLQEAARTGGCLSVMDVGGSLGSSYFQYRTLWRGAITVRWAVVEQEMFVDLGRREFTTSELSFHADVAAAVHAVSPTVALLSGVVGWVEEPHRLLSEVVSLGLEAIILDRNPIVSGDRDHLVVQRVPAQIGVASYPAWLLSRARFLSHFEGRYELRAEFEGRDRPSGPAVFRGFYFVRRKSPAHL